ncbi:MAG: hypothetical protein ABR549_15285 [Mycobacteriales bacterium]
MTSGDTANTQVTLVVTESKTVPSHPSPRPDSHLPFSGFELVAALVIAILLLAAGSFLVLVGRRPRPGSCTRSA